MLNRYGAAQRLHRTGECGQEAVACGLEQPPAMRGRQWLDEIGAQYTYVGQCGGLIRSDHGRIPDNIGCQNAGQATICVVHDDLPA
jgi:hypothetical protein